MSTKIYTGYRAPKDLDIVAWLNTEFRQKAQDICFDMMADYIAKETCLIIDCFTVLGRDVREEGENTNPLRRVTKRMRDNHARAITHMEAHPFDDFEMSVSAIILPDDDFMYLLIHADQNVYIKIFEENPKIEEYGYWDNSDRPDGVSVSEWKKRGQDWDRALPGAGVVSNSAFTMTLIGRYMPYVSRKMIAQKIPSIDERLETVWERLQYDFISNERPDINCVDMSVGEYISAARNYAKSDEGLALKERSLDKIRSVIDEDLSIEEILRMELPLIAEELNPVQEIFLEEIQGARAGMTP